MSQHLRSEAERRAYNEGVKAVLDLAARSAAAIEKGSKRRLHEGFAVASLEGLVEAGVGLLLQAEPIVRAVA